MATDTIIPLFPLNIVLFPGQTLQLYIFEERYKEMIADCRPIEAGGDFGPFGICLGPDDSMQQVGCTAQVREILKEHNDGRMNLVAVGLERYRVLEVYRDRPYLCGKVEFLQDRAELLDEDLVRRAVEGLKRLMTIAGGTEEPADLDVEPDKEGGHAFALGQRAGLNREERQGLLEIESENQRLARLVEIFEDMLPRLERKQARQRLVRSNGHFKNL